MRGEAIVRSGCNPQRSWAGLAAWAAEGVAHVQLWVEPVTGAGVETALDGLRRFWGA